MNRVNLQKNIVFFVVMLVVIISGFALNVFATTEPEGPTTLDIINTSRRQAADAHSIQAVAGNVTQLSIDGKTVTQTWQGYYGNVSGTLTLDDENNHTMYDWDLIIPRGEVYSSAAPIDFKFGNVYCYNYNISDYGYGILRELEEMEEYLGISPGDVDGLNETFTENQDYAEFYVGTWKISGNCPNVHLYDETGQSDSGKFTEVLLYENTTNELIFTSIIDDNVVGFNNRPWDFQMIVAENGHDGDTDPTTMYFYVELY